METNSLKSQFLLDPGITYLNFGSFGACPKPVFEEYQRWQLLLEREPVQFISGNGPSNLAKSRSVLAQYVHCDADDLVYVTNPSYAINMVAKSLPLRAGDEVLSTNLEYGALDRTWKYYCGKAGAKYVRQPITLPLQSKEKFIDDFFKGANAKTKAIFIGQITSATALRFPVKEVCEMAKDKGLITIVDGAHVPGHIPLNISELKPDVYTGACHKWMCTPKGCSFLYVKKEYQPLFDPLIISWGYQSEHPSHSTFIDYHQMQGTRDFSAFLSVPAAIRFMQENNWQVMAAGYRKMARDNYERFCDLCGTKPVGPVTEEFLGQMCSIPINCKKPEALKQLLLDKYRIEIPVMKQDDLVFVRYSLNAFNTAEDLEVLYSALHEIISETDLIDTRIAVSLS